MVVVVVFATVVVGAVVRATGTDEVDAFFFDADADADADADGIVDVVAS